MRVEEIMTTPVNSIDRNTSIKDIKDLFTLKGIHALPVVEEGGTISGIITVSDIASADYNVQIAEDIMTDRVHIVLPNNKVSDAANMMVKNKVQHLVVMNEGEVVGMISSMDIVRLYAVENVVG